MIYLDNSATTKPRKEVLDAFAKVNEHYYGNPASIHRMGNEAEDLLEGARTQIKQLLKMKHAVFTSGGTESNNLALFGVAKAYQHRGKHIITAPTEHPSVLKSIAELEKQGFGVTRLRVDRSGNIDLGELNNALRQDTILVSLMHVNNEIGTVHPIAEIQKLLTGSRALFHVDAVQSVGKIKLSADSMPDLLSISGHKIHGLKGSGALAFNQVELQPILHGGGQEFGLRSGTVAVPQAAALAKALRLAEPKSEYAKWNSELRAFFMEFNGVKIISPETAAPHILAVALKGMKGEVLVTGLQQESVIVSTSSACSSKSKETSHVIKAIGVSREYQEGVIRISFGAFTTEQDILGLKKAFARVYRLVQ